MTRFGQSQSATDAPAQTSGIHYQQAKERPQTIKIQDASDRALDRHRLDRRLTLEPHEPSRLRGARDWPIGFDQHHPIPQLRILLAQRQKRLSAFRLAARRVGQYRSNASSLLGSGYLGRSVTIHGASQIASPPSHAATAAVSSPPHPAPIGVVPEARELVTITRIEPKISLSDQERRRIIQHCHWRRRSAILRP